MIILSNGFPANMPNSEEISQGGPANFARLFVGHIVSSTSHKWIGVMFNTSESSKISLNKALSLSQRDYFKLNVPKELFRKIVLAKKNDNPYKILRSPIERIASLIKREKPDVVFLNGFGLFNWILLKAAEQTNTPVVIQHAGIWSKELRLHRHLYSSAGLKIMEEMEKESTRVSLAEVFLNSWSRDYYKKHVAKKINQNAPIIPLPFDFASFSGNSENCHKTVFSGSKNILRIGTIARWDKIKNHKVFLSLSKLASKKSLPWRFYSVVKIPDDHRSKKTYKKNIFSISSLNRAGISDFCQSMDLLVLPSLFDVSPTVVLEAIATNTPIVISQNVGYVNDFIEHGAEDWVIDFSNSCRALKKIQKILKRPMPESLKKYIAENHDYKKVFSSYLNLFASVSKKNNYGALRIRQRGYSSSFKIINVV